MKKLVFVLAIVVMLFAATLAGCTQPQPATTPPANIPVPTTNITNVTPAPDVQTPPVVAAPLPTVVNPIGFQIFPVNPAPAFTFAGKTCTLQDVQDSQAAGQPLDCTIVQDGEMGILEPYVPGA